MKRCGVKSSLTDAIRWGVFRRYAMRLVEQNLERGEISARIENDLYLIECCDGTTLSCPREDTVAVRGDLPWMDGVSPGAEAAVLQYLLRYKFPHYDPSNRPQTVGVPSVIARHLFLHKQHHNTFLDLPENERSGLVERFALRPDEVVLEAGPYLGFGTVRMSRQVGPLGRVISAEPIERNRSMVMRNLRSNGIMNVSLHRCAVGGIDGTAHIRDGGRQANSLVWGVVTGGATPCEVLRIETLAKREKAIPTLIVLTINGAELMAVEGSRDYLSSLRNIRMIVPGWYSDENGTIGPRLVRLLEQLGFSVTATPGHMVFAYK